MQSVEKSAEKRASVFAAYDREASAAFLSLKLPKSAKDLLSHLHTIAPFGNFYAWNDEVNPTTIRGDLKRSTGKDAGSPMSVRTYQEACKILVEEQYIAISKNYKKHGGFRLLKQFNSQRWKNCQVEDQGNVFLDPEERNFSRDRAPKAPPVKQSQHRIDPEGSTDLFKETKTPAKSSVGRKKEFPNQTANGGSGKNSRKRKKLTRKQVQSKSTTSSDSTKRTYIPAPAFTKLNERQLELLASIGVPKERVNRNLVNELQKWTERQLEVAVDYVAWMRDRKDTLPIRGFGGYLIRALQNRWRRPTTPTAPGQSYLPDEEREWLNLAYNELGLCRSTKRRDGELDIFFNDDPGVPTPFPLARQRYPIERLQEMVQEKQQAQAAIVEDRDVYGSNLSPAFVPPPPPPPPAPEPVAVMTPEDAQQIFAMAPADPDPEVDLRLKSEWLLPRIAAMGQASFPLLESWDAFSRGDVQLAWSHLGWQLEKVLI